MTKESGQVRFAWEGTGVTYNLYRGTLGALGAGIYDHGAFGHCGVVGNSALFNPGDGNYYYLVTADLCGGAGDTSYGRDSAGTERPTAAQTTGNVCP